MAPSPTVARKAPGQSTWCGDCSLQLSGNFAASRMITKASGKFRKNTQRQVECSISQPPITGPTAAVIAEKPDQVPIACPLVFSGNVAVISARLPGTSRAAPSPCIERAKTKILILLERPHHAEATAKIATPPTYTFLLPKASPSEPPTRSSAAKKSA